MVRVTLHGGVDEIGGNKFIVEDGDTRILMDFGMSFSHEGMFFAEFLNARGSNYLNDMFALGILPKLKGLYRRDYARHMGFDGREDTAFDAVLLTHAHVDHCAYIPYLREDIPIYCSEESMLIMKNFDETSTSQYITMKEKFRVKYNEKSGKHTRASGEETEIPRRIEVRRPGDKFNIGSVDVEMLPVDHSIPGVCALLLHTSGGTLANTGDLRFNGRRKRDTDRFVERCAESDLDLLLCEGTRVDVERTDTEEDMEKGVSRVLNTTRELAVCTYPVRDLDRLLSIYNAAVASNRHLVISLNQANLLDLFDRSEHTKGMYPSPTDKNVRIYLPRGSWSLIDKDPGDFPDMLPGDYGRLWQRRFLDYSNAIDYRHVRDNQRDLVFFCSDFTLQDLIDVRPKPGSSYVRSSTEPFNEEMRLSSERIKNWLVHFGLLKEGGKWEHFHISGHGDGPQIKSVIDGTRPKRLVPIHTEHPEYHQKWHKKTEVVKNGDIVAL